MTIRNKSLLVVLGLLGVFIGYMSFTGESTEGKDLVYKSIYAVSSMFVALSVGAVFGLLFMVVNTFTKKQKGIVGHHELVIKDDGIEEISEINTSLHKWAGMNGILEMKNMFLLYVTEASAHVIPKDRTKVDGDLDLFIDTVRSKLKKSNQS